MWHFRWLNLSSMDSFNLRIRRNHKRRLNIRKEFDGKKKKSGEKKLIIIIIIFYKIFF